MACTSRGSMAAIHYKRRCRRAVTSSSRKLVKEEIDGGNLAVPDDYEIGSGVSWRLAEGCPTPTGPERHRDLLRGESG